MVTGFTMVASTGDQLHASLGRAWAREAQCHAQLQARTPTYAYPPLVPPPKPSIQSSTDQYWHSQSCIPRHLHWSHDGSCFVTINEDHGCRLYVVPPDVIADPFDTLGPPQELVPFTRTVQPYPILSHAVDPRFSLYNPPELMGRNTILLAMRNLPIRMMDLLPTESPQARAQYKFGDLQNDRFYPAYSLAHLSDTHFAAGTANRVGLFDVHRQHAPLSIIESRACGMGIVSTLLPSPQRGITFAGSYNGTVAVLDPACATVVLGTRGTRGITQLLEATNGKYLYAIERNSANITILDLRMDLAPVATLTQATASRTNQKLTADLLPQAQGLVIGDTQGNVQWFRDAELGVDGTAETLILTASRSPVSSVRVNPAELGMLAVASGHRNEDADHESSSAVLNDCGVELWFSGTTPSLYKGN